MRLTLQHPDHGRAAIAMWWKVAEGITTEADFSKFRQTVLNAPIEVNEKKGIADISVITPSGKLGVKADLANKNRLNYYNPSPLPDNYLFNVDGIELGKPIMKKYQGKN